jgi:hypothetical protein
MRCRVGRALICPERMGKWNGVPKELWSLDFMMDSAGLLS